MSPTLPASAATAYQRKMRRFLPALLAIVLALGISFGSMPAGHFAAAGVQVQAADLDHRSGSVGTPRSATDDCCGVGLSHAPDGFQCSFQCAPAVWGPSLNQSLRASAISALSDVSVEGSAAPTPFRPPIV